MAERGHRVYATQRVRVSREIGAPLRFVYDWCTDYRSDDWRLSPRRPAPKFRILRLSPRRLLRVRVTPTDEPDPAVAVDVIRLNPPNAWHTDQIDEDDRESVDYRLTALGRARTRIDLLVTERWLTPRYPTRPELIRRVQGAWERYAPQIEARYRSGRPAKGGSGRPPRASSARARSGSGAARSYFQRVRISSRRNALTATRKKRSARTANPPEMYSRLTVVSGRIASAAT